MSFNRNRLLILLSILLALLLIFYLFLKPFNYLSDFLSKSEQIDANILLVEGWLPYQALETAAADFKSKRYDYIITTGIRSTPEYYGVNTNGYLIFYLRKNLAHPSQNNIHLIEIKAFSQLEGENSAHFKVWINDRLAEGFFADTQKRKYAVKWKGSVNDIDSVMIQFDNDKRGSFGDRNLFVKEIIIDHKDIIPYLNNSEYDMLELDGRNRIKNKMRSNAELARYRLFSLGIDTTLIIAVPGKKVRINRTLTSALALRKWIPDSGITINGINIISSGTHARRTWMTFSKVLGENYKIGIIALPDTTRDYSRKRRFLKTIRETAAIIYYWIILLPY